MKPLAIAAVGGFAISVVCFSLRAALAVDDGAGSDGLDWLLDRGPGPACKHGAVSRERITREWNWEGGDKAEINLPATVHYRRGSGDRVTATGQEWALDHLRIDGSDIAFNFRSMRNFGRIEITLPGFGIDRFEVNGGGRLHLEDVQQRNLKISIRGSGDVDASGQIERAEVSIAGSGKVRMGSVVLSRLELSIAGSGDAEVAPKDEAKIHIMGSGDVRLLTLPPRLETNITGSGHITGPDDRP